MVRIPPVFALLLAALPFSGCLGSEEAETQQAAPAPEPGPVLVSNTTRGSEIGWAAAAGGVDGHPAFFADGVIGVDFPAPRNATLWRAEANWTCDVGVTCGAIFQLFPPGEIQPNQQPLATAKGDGHAVVQAADPEPGRWQVRIDPDGPSAQMHGTIDFTVVHYVVARAPEPDRPAGGPDGS